MSRATSSGRAIGALVVLVGGFVFLPVMAAVPGSPLGVPLPAGVATPAWASHLARSLGLDRLTAASQVVLALSVMIALLAAFVVLLVEARAGRVRTAIVLVATAISLSAMALGPLMLSRDVHSYAAYGRTVTVHGANPYRLPPAAFGSDPFTPVVSGEWLDTRSVYGPVFTLVSAAIAGAWSGSATATILAFKVLAALAMMGAVLLVVAACRATRPERAALAAVAIGLNPVLVVDTVGGGHNDTLVAFGLAAALFLAIGGASASEHTAHVRRLGRRLAVTALLTATALVKVVAVIPLALWFGSTSRAEPKPQRLRTLAAHCGVAVALTVAVTAPLYAGSASIAASASLASRRGWASPARLVGRGAEAIGRAVGGQAFGDALRTVVFVAFLMPMIVFVFGHLRGWPSLVRHDERDGHGLGVSLAATWGTALLLFALGAPYLLPWYAAWFVVLLPAADDDGLLAIALGASMVLALTGIPAEARTDPSAWRAMVLGVHYVAAPAMLVLFGLTIRRVFGAPVRRPEPGSPAPAVRHP